MPTYLDFAKTADDMPIRLLQLSDSHLLADPHKKFAGILPFLSLQKVIEHTRLQQPFDCVISTGDIAQESKEETYQQYFTAVEELNTPHFWIKGNHDYNINFPSQTELNNPHVIIIGQWCLILINSQVDGKVHGRISAEHLKQLQQHLSDFNNYHVLIALHHNTFDVGCAWLDPHGLQNADEFLASITAYPNVRLVISGHVHQDYTYLYQNIQFISCPSTSVQFKPNSKDFCLDLLTPGYRIFELYQNGDFSTQVFRLKENIGEIDLSLSEY